MLGLGPGHFKAKYIRRRRTYSRRKSTGRRKLCRPHSNKITPVTIEQLQHHKNEQVECRFNKSQNLDMQNRKHNANECQLGSACNDDKIRSSSLGSTITLHSLPPDDRCITTPSQTAKDSAFSRFLRFSFSNSLLDTASFAHM